MSGTRFQMKVIGEDKVRARGELAFVLPQALDLVSRSSYTASITEATHPPRGALRLRRTDNGDIEASYTNNPGFPAMAKGRPPAWLDSVETLSGTLGRTITWQPVT